MKHVIFLHGFCEHAAMWEETIGYLTSSNFTYHTIDLPGFGKNEKTVDSISAMSDFVIGYMDERGIELATIVGHSMGGYVALEMAAMHDSRVDAIGLIHSHAAADGPDKRENRLKLIDFVSRNGSKGFLKEFSKKLLSPVQSEKALREKAYHLVKDTKTEAIIAATNAMINRKDHTGTIQHCTKPILWVIGSLDTFVAPENVIIQAVSCPQSQVEILNDVGHLCMYEVPQKTAEVIDNFLTWSNQSTQ